MFVINPYTGRYISTESRRCYGIEKTGVLDLTIRRPIERKAPEGTKGLDNEEDPLRHTLKRANTI